jgi:hypothetical protein
MGTDEYYYVPLDQVPDERVGPMLVERLMLDVKGDHADALVRLTGELRRMRAVRGPNVKLFVTVAAVMPATPWEEPT